MTDQQLAEMFENLARDLPAAPDVSLREVQQRADRRRTLHRVTVAAAALVVVVGTAGVLVLGQPGSAPVVDDAGPTASSPPLDEGPVTMLLSPAPFPASGGPLALTVVNRSAQDFSYGVDGQLDKWEDGAWQPVGRFASALTSWHGIGQVEGGDEPVFKNDIRLSALPRTAGPLEWLSLPRLEPGWYRFTRSSVDDEQRVAAAILRVSEDAEGPELTAPGDGPVLNLEPAALEPGAHRLRFALTAPEQNRGEDIPDLRASMAQMADLEAWVDSTWKEVAELEVDMNPTEPRGNLYEWAVRLPNLDAGAYRLVQDSNTAGPVVGHFWITELLTEDSPTDSGTLGERPRSRQVPTRPRRWPTSSMTSGRPSPARTRSPSWTTRPAACRASVAGPSSSTARTTGRCTRATGNATGSATGRTARACPAPTPTALTVDRRTISLRPATGCSQRGPH